MVIFPVLGDFPRLFVPHLVSMQPPQSEVEIVCSVQSHLEARVGWIVFAEDIEMTEIGDNGEIRILDDEELIEDPEEWPLPNCQRKGFLLFNPFNNNKINNINYGNKNNYNNNGNRDKTNENTNKNNRDKLNDNDNNKSRSSSSSNFKAKLFNIHSNRSKVNNTSNNTNTTNNSNSKTDTSKTTYSVTISIVKDCFVAEFENATKLRNGTQRIILTFKINQTSECLTRIKEYQETCHNQTQRLLNGACVAVSSAGRTVSGFTLRLADTYFDYKMVTESAHFFGFHRSFWTNSTEQRHKYDREFQKAAGFIVGMCLPIVILLYMSFYLTCCKNSGNHDANMFGADSM